MKVRWKKFCAAALTAVVCTGFVWNVPVLNSAAAESSDTGVSKIPGTTSTESTLNGSFLSVTGFAKGKVNDRSGISKDSDEYAVVTNETEFFEALAGAKSGDVRVIEIRSDLYLGWFELSDEAKSAGSGIVEAYEGSETIGSTPVGSPSLIESGISTVTVNNVDGLTIFSPEGNTIRHAEIKFNSGVNDLVIRNLEFTDSWEWDDNRVSGFGSSGGSGNRKRTGWTNIKLNGCNNVWIDHCTFGNSFDGNIDIENGSSGITISWSKIGDDDVSVGSNIYKTAMYLEELYNQNKTNEDVSSFRIYKIMRDNGMTMEQIMKYMSQHDKCHLVGAGDKDSWLYKDENGKYVADKEKANANELLRVSLAYNYYSDIGQRLPMIRSGVGHLYNCYINDWNLAEVNQIINSDPMGTGKTIRQQVSDAGLSLVTLTRGMDARDGASIAADTCVYYGCDTPITGTAYHPMGANISSGYENVWDYNYALIVNSSVQKPGQTAEQAYTGSSWDNNGNNPFIPDSDYWNETKDANDDRKAADKLIGNWSWGQEGIDNDNKLSYDYQTFPLEDVKKNTETYSGFRQIEMSASDWLKTEYSADYAIKAVDHTTEVPMESLSLSKTSATLFMQEEFLQLDAKALPYNTTETADTYTWESSNTDIATVNDCGLVIPVTCGSVTITVTSKNGLKASCDVLVANLASDIEVSGIPSQIYVGDIFRLSANVLPGELIDESVTWDRMGIRVEVVDADKGIFKAVKAGRNETIQVTTNLKGNRIGNNGYTKRVKLSEIKESSALVTGVSTDAVTKMAVGTTGQLQAQVFPENATNKNVVWEVSDSAVAAVAENGVVTAAGVGTTYATVRTINGGYMAQCKIVVTTDAGVTPIPDPTPTPDPVTGDAVTPGDVNGDSEITLVDAQMTLKIALKLMTPTESQMKAADVDGNGIVELSDAQKILKAALKIESLPEISVKKTICPV